MEIKAIDTIYNDHRFRSRLEARWAVFFDEMKLSYLYEPEGFQLGSIRYLPDFFLPNGIRFADEEMHRQNVWVEIKPSAQLDESDRQKIAQFVKQTGYSLLLIAGEPGEEARLRFITYDNQKTVYSASDVKWIELGNQELGLLNIEGFGQEVGNDTRTALNRLSNTQPILAAFSAAKQARFEHTDSSSSFTKTGSTRTCESCGTTFFAEQSYHRLCYPCYKARRDGSPITSVETKDVPLSLSTNESSSVTSNKVSPLAKVSLFRVQTRIGLGIVLIVLLIGALLAFRAVRDDTNTVDQLVPTLPAEETTPNPLATSKLTSTPTISSTTEQQPDQGNGETLSDIAPCICTENTYNCRDFESSADAQACFEYCLASTGDIHELDRDGDKQVCEPTRTPNPE